MIGRKVELEAGNRIDHSVQELDRALEGNRTMERGEGAGEKLADRARFG
jgi:hypothetical protein